VQVETAMTKVKNCMPIYDRKYNLHGLTDKTCTVVADIRHQGRARSPEIIDAINTRGTEDNVYHRLLELGAHAYEKRIQNLENFINKLEAEGIFGIKRYDRTVNNFV
jgi:hypothetical protein